MRTYHRLAESWAVFCIFTKHNHHMENNKNNSGALFRNDKRETEKHPEYTGKITIEGNEYYLSAWVNESARTGQKYFSIKAAPKAATAPAATTTPARPQTSTIADPVDDLPF